MCGHAHACLVADEYVQISLTHSVLSLSLPSSSSHSHSYTYTRVPECSPTTYATGQLKVNSALQERMGGMEWTMLKEKKGEELSGESGPSGTGFTRKMYQTW